MKKQIIIYLAAVSLGLLAGYGIRALVKQEQVSGSTLAGKNTPPADPAVTSALANTTETLPAKDETTGLSETTGVLRWLHWVASLENATLEDMPRLAKFPAGDRAAESMLVARWMELDPMNLFEYATGPEGSALPSRILSSLFDEWFRSDLPAAVQALRESEAPPIRSLRRNYSSRIIEKDPKLGIELFHEWGITNHTPRKKSVKKWAERDPEGAAEFVIAHESGSVTRAAIEGIGDVWGKSDPEAGLAYVDGMRSKRAWELGSQILKSWAADDLEGAAAWLGNADPEAHRRLAQHSPASGEGKIRPQPSPGPRTR